jgi:hypothetical protein
MYPVDLENNERSCEYSSIVRGGFRGGVRGVRPPKIRKASGRWLGQPTNQISDISAYAH